MRKQKDTLVMSVLCMYFCLNSFLATRESYNGLKSPFRLGLTTVHRAIKETCDAIWDVLKDEMLPIVI